MELSRYPTFTGINVVKKEQTLKFSNDNGMRKYYQNVFVPFFTFSLDF